MSEENPVKIENPEVRVEAEEINFVSSVTDFAKEVVSHVRSNGKYFSDEELQVVIRALCRAACEVSTLSDNGMLAVQFAEDRETMRLWFVHNTDVIHEDPVSKLDYVFKELKHHVCVEPTDREDDR